MNWFFCFIITASTTIVFLCMLIQFHFRKKDQLRAIEEKWKREKHQSEEEFFMTIGSQERRLRRMSGTIAEMEKKHDFDRRLAAGEIANYLGQIEELRKLFYGTKKVKKININRERTQRDTKEKLKT